jgi:LPS-assembly lipoprotein
MKNAKKPYQIRLYFSGIFASLLLLTSCGFQPIYGNIGTSVNQPNTEELMRRIDIGLINDREGQFLRNALIDRLHNSASPLTPLYTLSLTSITEARRSLDITKESDATIANLKLSTEMAFTRISDNKLLLKKKIWSTTSYNILESQFTTRVSQNYARENGLKNLAAQIERQVSLALNAQDTKIEQVK